METAPTFPIAAILPATDDDVRIIGRDDVMLMKDVTHEIQRRLGCSLEEAVQVVDFSLSGDAPYQLDLFDIGAWGNPVKLEDRGAPLFGKGSNVGWVDDFTCNSRWWDPEWVEEQRAAGRWGMPDGGPHLTERFALLKTQAKRLIESACAIVDRRKTAGLPVLGRHDATRLVDLAYRVQRRLDCALSDAAFLVFHSIAWPAGLGMEFWLLPSTGLPVLLEDGTSRANAVGAFQDSCWWSPAEVERYVNAAVEGQMTWSGPDSKERRARACAHLNELAQQICIPNEEAARLLEDICKFGGPSLLAAVQDYVDVDFEDLPQLLQEIVTQRYHPHWRGLNKASRLSRAEMYDLSHSAEAEEAFERDSKRRVVVKERERVANMATHTPLERESQQRQLEKLDAEIAALEARTAGATDTSAEEQPEVRAAPKPTDAEGTADSDKCLPGPDTSGQSTGATPDERRRWAVLRHRDLIASHHHAPNQKTREEYEQRFGTTISDSMLRRWTARTDASGNKISDPAKKNATAWNGFKANPLVDIQRNLNASPRKR